MIRQRIRRIVAVAVTRAAMELLDLAERLDPGGDVPEPPAPPPVGRRRPVRVYQPVYGWIDG